MWHFFYQRNQDIGEVLKHDIKYIFKIKIPIVQGLKCKCTFQQQIFQNYYIYNHVPKIKSFMLRVYCKIVW